MTNTSKGEPHPHIGHRAKICWLYATIFIFALWPLHANLSIEYDSEGIQGLRVEGTPLIASPSHGKPLVWYDSPVMTDRDSSTKAQRIPNHIHFKNQKLLHEFDWGTMEVEYIQGDEKLDMVVRVENTSDQLLEHLRLILMRLTFPEIPTATCPGDGTNLTWYHDAHPNINPGIIAADFGSGTVVFCNEDITDHTVIKIAAAKGGSEVTTFFYECQISNLLANSSQTHRMSLRSGPSGSSLSDLAPDLQQKYDNHFPFTLHWPDRRMMMANFLCSPFNTTTVTNPRGWTFAPNIDISTNSGLEDFRTQLLQRADSIISRAVEADAQGVITWDIEGAEHKNVHYKGDPRDLSAHAPELEYQGAHATPNVDAYFQRFKDAGLRIGITIRPQTLTAVSSGYQQLAYTSGIEAKRQLQAKIEYAIDRWDCQLFYIDSNSSTEGITPTWVIRELQQQYPNVLLIPEHDSTSTYSCSMPYKNTTKLGFGKTHPEIKAIYPNSGAILKLFKAPDDDFNRSIWEQDIFQAVAQGDILLVNGWYDHNEIDTAMAAYAAHQPPQANINLTKPNWGARYSKGASIHFKADATISGASIDRVEFFYNTIEHGRQYCGQDSSAPYQLQWPIPVEWMGHLAQLQAVAVDTLGRRHVSASTRISTSLPLGRDVHLQGAWRLNDKYWNGTEGEVRDQSGLKHHGQALGSVTLIDQGRVGKGAQFLVDGDALKAPINPRMAHRDWWTVSLWFKSENKSDMQGLLGIIDPKRSHNATASLILNANRWRSHKAGCISGVMRLDGTNNLSFQSDDLSDVWADGQWHHLVVMIDKRHGEVELWLDAVQRPLSISKTGSIHRFTFDSQSQFHMGSAFINHWSTPRSLAGAQDEVYLWTRRLSPIEIQQLKQAP